MIRLNNITTNDDSAGPHPFLIKKLTKGTTIMAIMVAKMSGSRMDSTNDRVSTKTYKPNRIKVALA